MKGILRRAAMLAATAAVALGGAGMAGAQVSRSLTVAVLTFNNTSGTGGSLVGSRASAAVETQLIESGRYDVVKRDLVQRTMTDLNLSYPLGRLGITQLAQALEADAVISGDVVRITRDTRTSQMRAVLRVEMTDRSSGELVNGAVATGESGIRPDFSGAEDVLLDEALFKAAFAAVRSMTERILPEGTVFATSTRQGSIEALLNIGSNSGVRSGMEFIVLRNREQVGRLRITGTTPTDSTAAVISTTRGVQPEDKVRAVFRLENVPAELGGTGASTANVRRPRMNVSNLVIGALALFGVSRLAGGTNVSRGVGARSATAVSTGPFNGAPVSSAVETLPAIKVSWRAPVGVNQQDIVGYALYRMDQNGLTEAIRFFDRGNTTHYDTGEARTVSGALGDIIEQDDVNVDGLVPGRPQRYLIRTVYLSRATDTGGGTDQTYRQAQDVITNTATGLLPPPLQPTTATDITAVDFNFQRVPGGDRYIIQVADNPNFRNADQYPNNSDGMALPAPPAGLTPVQYYGQEQDDAAEGRICVPGGNEDCIGSVDYTDLTQPLLGPIYAPLETMRVNLVTGRLDPNSPSLYWRVGVRRSSDDQRPENGGWVWSNFQALNRGADTTAIGQRTAPRPQKKPGVIGIGSSGPIAPSPTPEIDPTERPGMRTGGSRGKR